jgi:hypothetical protein
MTRRPPLDCDRTAGELSKEVSEAVQQWRGVADETINNVSFSKW